MQAPARKPYPSDVSDEEWALVAPYLTLLREDAERVLAAAGLVALGRVEALADDHTHATRLAEGLTELGWQITTPQTNIVLAEVPDVRLTLDRLRDCGVLAVPMDGHVRFVTHRNVGKRDIEEALRRIKRSKH